MADDDDDAQMDFSDITDDIADDIPDDIADDVSKPASKAPFLASEHSNASKLSADFPPASASKPPSGAATPRGPGSTTSATPPRPPSRSSEAAGGGPGTNTPGPGPGSVSRSTAAGLGGGGGGGGGSRRPTPPSSVGRPDSPVLSNDLADVAGPGPSRERSAASLTRGPPSVTGSFTSGRDRDGEGDQPPPWPTPGGPSLRPGSAGGSLPGVSPPPSIGPASGNRTPASGTRTPAGPSRPPSILAGDGGREGSVAGGRGSVGGGSRSGVSLNGSLPPPEQVQTPKVRQAGQLARTSFGGGGAAGGGRASFSGGDGGGGARESKAERLRVQCHIPTPFELFRCYDADLNGRVTAEEFFLMLRDLDGHPLHYAPQDDPEHKLEGVRSKCNRNSALLESIEAKLEKATMGSGAAAPPEYLRSLKADRDTAVAHVAELQSQIRSLEGAARELVHHPDEAVRVTPERRQHRAQWRRWVEAEFDRADLSGNRILSVDEFYMYYYGKLCFRFPVQRTGVNPGAVLFNIFVRYCSIGRGAVGGRNEDMLLHQFAKLCKNAGLLKATGVTRAAVDIIYHRARAADEALETYTPKAGVAATARMYYPQFLFALDKLAEKRKSGFQEVVACILAAEDHLPEPSFADFLIMDGTDIEPGAEVPEYLMRPEPLPSNVDKLKSLADNEIVQAMKREADVARRLSLGEGHAKAAGGGLQAFRAAQKAAAAGGPGGSTATLGADLRGSETAGGPSEGPPAARRSNMYGDLPPPSLNPTTLRERKWERPEPSAVVESRIAAVKHGVAPVNWPQTMHAVRGMDPDSLMAAVKRVFEAYSTFYGGVDRTALDKRAWSKALRDAVLVTESGALPARKAELVYGKVLPANCRALNFLQFIEALRHVAIIHRIALNEVMERLVAGGGPRPGV